MDKRYNLVMPDDLAKEVERVAKEEKITLVSFFRRCIKLGLLAHELSRQKDCALLVKRGGEIQRIYFV